MQMRNIIQIPSLCKQKERRVYAQLRPYRQGGFRLQIKDMFGKTFLLNYGHGGAGISLAHGSAIMGCRLLAARHQNYQQIAVIGSGIIGLTQALEFKRRFPSANITIYSQRIPNVHQSANAQLITSSIAPGYWLPYAYGRNLDSFHFQIAQLSYNYLKDSIKKKEYADCIQFCEVYDMNETESAQQLSSMLLPEQKQKFCVIDVAIKINNSQNKIIRSCKRFETIKLNMPILLKRLIKDCESQNIKFVKRCFQSLEKMQCLSQNFISVCTGYGSKKIVDDPLMKGIKGHILEYDNPNPQVFNYIFKFSTSKGVISLYCHSDRILLGLSRQQTDSIEIDSQEVAMLKDRWAALENSFTKFNKPKL